MSRKSLVVSYWAEHVQVIETECECHLPVKKEVIIYISDNQGSDVFCVLLSVYCGSCYMQARVIFFLVYHLVV